MAFFYSFTDSLKQKWLQFYASNCDWIKLHMEVDSVYTPDGGKRPSSYLILGVVNALEPKLAQLMLPFSKLNADADTLVEVLDLHFDPDTALGKQSIQTVSEEGQADDAELSIDENPDQFARLASQINDSDDNDDSQDVTLVVVEEAWGGQDFSANSQSEESGLDDIQVEGLEDISVEEESAFDKSEQNSSIEEDDAFGDISFDEFKDGDSTGFGDALTDVWGEESANKDNEIFLGEDTNDESIDDSEIARLFPNS